MGFEGDETAFQATRGHEWLCFTRGCDYGFQRRVRHFTVCWELPGILPVAPERHGASDVVDQATDRVGPHESGRHMWECSFWQAHRVHLFFAVCMHDVVEARQELALVQDREEPGDVHFSRVLAFGIGVVTAPPNHPAWTSDGLFLLRVQAWFGH